MRKNFSILVTIAVICAMSAVSCGNDKTEESSVTLDLPVVTTQAEESETSETTETTAKATTEKTTSKKEETSETSTSAETTKETKTTTEVSSETTTAEESDEPATEPPAEDITDPPADEPQQTEPPVDTPTDFPAPQTVQFSIDNLNSDAGGIISALGDALDVQYAQGCLSNGADQKIYVYDGLTLNCYVMDGVEYIYQIEIKNSNYSTSAGITVGSSRSDAESVYGAGEESGNYVIYYNGSSELDIEYNGDTVTSIIFYIPV
ncbi:MAG: hypothetical protein K2H19_04065 [Ruminococcus sp.]|nr:hypothetical protein [Ruminococcus sp.]